MKTLLIVALTANLFMFGFTLVAGAGIVSILKNNRQFSVVSTDAGCAVAIGKKADLHAMMQMAGYER